MIIASATPGGEPPKEFRIFTAGKVVTTKGTFTFDQTAAKAVMAEYAAHGIDLAVDYDHASLGGSSADPAQAGKAAGWFNIELRNGELWAVNVRWTEPAAQALRAKEWRFMSPAFSTDKDGRVTSLFNVAITNLPATRRLEPLMAASKTKGNGPMTIDELLAVCKALKFDTSTATLEEVMAKLGASPVDADADTEDAPPPKGDGGADEADEPKAASRRRKLAAAPPAPKDADTDPKKMEKVKQIAEIVGADPLDLAAVLAAVQALLGLDGAEDTAPDAADPEQVVARASILRVTSTKTLGAAAAHVKALSRELQTVASERDELVNAERIRLCSKLVTECGRAPAKVWASPDAQIPKAFLQKMSIAELRAHVEEEKSGGTPRTRHALRAPVSGGGGTQAGARIFSTPDGDVELSKREQSMCVEMKIEPKDYAAQKAARGASAS